MTDIFREYLKVLGLNFYKKTIFLYLNTANINTIG